MANKALKEARKAYNKNKSTKNRIDIETGEKITKKKKPKTKSHYGQVDTKNKEIGGTNAKKALNNNKTGKQPVKAHYGQVESKTRNTSGSLAAKVTNTYKSNVQNAQENKSKLSSSHFGQVTQSKIDQSEEAGKKKFGVGTYSTANAKKAKTDSDKAQEKLEKKGKKTVQTLSDKDLKAKQDEAEDRAKKQTAWFAHQMEIRGKMSREEAEEAVRKAGENARKKTKEDHSLTYSNATMSNEDFQREMNAAPHANVKVKDEKEREKAIREARFYTNSQVASGNMTKEYADEIIKQAGKGHWTTQSAQILDKLGGEGTAEESGTRQAGQMNDSKFFSGVLQGTSYGDNTRAIGKYNDKAAELVDTVKNSGAYNVGYGVGQMGQFVLGGTGKMTDALVKGVAKSGALRSSLNVGLRKAGADVLFETPINVLDAKKMATDANGNFDPKAFRNYMALNTGLSGGMGGLIGGVGTKLAKNDAKTYIRLTEKMKAGEDLSPQELKAFENVQKKLDDAMKGGDTAKGDVAANAKADVALSKADAKEYMTLRAKQNSGKITQQERARLASYTSMITQNFKEAQDKFAKTLADVTSGENVPLKDVKESAEFFERNGNTVQSAEANSILAKEEKKQVEAKFKEDNEAPHGLPKSDEEILREMNEQEQRQFEEDVKKHEKEFAEYKRTHKDYEQFQKIDDLEAEREKIIDEIDGTNATPEQEARLDEIYEQIEEIKKEIGAKSNDDYYWKRYEALGKVRHDLYEQNGLFDKAYGKKRKDRQFEIINENNPKDKSLGDHTWVESVDDIKTFDEAINSDEAGFTPDFTKEMADEALEKGEITVYSSKPIEDGAFVTPSKMEAEAYAGNGKVFEQTIKTDDVAWLDELQGQVAKISDEPQAKAKPSKVEEKKPDTNAEETPKEENTNAEKTTAFKESEEYKTFKETPSKYASNRLKEMTDVADNYGVDVAPRIKEFNDLNKQIKEWKGKSKTSKTPEHIAEYKANIEAAEVRQTVIAESIYQDVARERLKVAGVDSTAVGEIRKATESIGGVGTIAKDIKNANKGAGSKKAQKLVSEEMKDYKGCLDKYLKGDEDLDMQNARASALLDNIAERLSKNADDADAMDDLMKVTDKLSEDGTIPTSVRSSTYELMAATPKGRVGMALKTVEDLNKKYGERIDGTLKLTDEEKTKFATTTDPDELANAYKELSERLWDEIPATRIEKLNEIRHMFMLLNVRTHARNMLGNFSFRGIRKEADELEAFLQNRFRKSIEKRGGEVDRVYVKKADIKEHQEYLDKEFHAIYDKSDSKTRWKETNRPDGVPTVKMKALNWLIQKDYKLLETEDMWTFIPAFRKSYMQYVNAKGWDISSMTEAQQKMARERALFDAEYATFRDTSAFSAWLTGKKHLLATKQGKTIWGTGFYRMGNIVLEGLMPFVKTPVNIFRRSVDYSPISLFRAIGEMSSKDPEVFKQGIKHLSTGLTGTQIFGLGFYLSNSGLISIDTQLGSHSGSKYYDQDMGYQDYSLVINIGGKKQSWTIDWLQPMQASLFMGAAFKDMVEDLMDGEGNLGTDTISALFAVTSPMLDASFMSSTKDMVESFQRRAGKETAEGEPDMAGALAQALFGDLPKNYISSAVPQLISQSANVIDPYKRDTRSTIEDPILASWDTAGKQMINRIPVLREKLLNPKIDRWGEDVKTGNNIATRLFFSMINPSNVKDITENKYDRELIKIRNKGTEKGSNDYKFFFYNFTGNPQYELANGKRMNYKELYEYGKSNRIEQTNCIHNMIDAKSYKGMTWEMRAEEVDNAHWIGNMVADHDTYGVNYAIKAMRNSTSSRDESDTNLYNKYAANAGKDKDNEAFWDYRVNKERMYSRGHATGDDSYRIKALCAIETGDKTLVKTLNLKGGKQEDMQHYWDIVSDKFGKKAKDKAFEEITDGCCFISNYLKDNKIEATDLGIKSASAGLSAKNGDKLDERVYRALGHFWNSAQAGGGLQLKYNKDGKYDLKNLEAMSDQLDAKIDARPKGMSQKDVVCDFIENDLGITNADEAACVYQVLYLKGNGKRWKNPYKDTINDWLEWGDNHDDEWGVGGGKSGGGRGGRRGRRGGGGGSGKGKMPKTASGAINGKVTNPFAGSNTSSASNLNDAYRKKVRKLREKTYK